MISFRHFTKTYRAASGPVTAVLDTDLEVRPGEFLAIRGPSGCGKTTLLLAAGGMMRPSAGEVLVGGRDLYGMSAAERADYRAREVGFVFQMFHLVPYLTVLDNVILAAAPAGNKQARERARALLEELGLGGRSGHKPGALSTGERQRAAIARAVLNKPKLILADEPTGNLDPDNATGVFRHLQDFHKQGATVVVVSHGDMVNDYADRVVSMRGGRIEGEKRTRGNS